MNIAPDMKPTLKQLVFRLLFVRRFMNNAENFVNMDFLTKRMEDVKKDIIDECIRMYEDDFKSEFGDR